MATALTILLAIGFPWLAYRLHTIPGFPHGLSPAVLCYAVGILIGNLAPQWVDGQWARQLSEAGMLVGLPLLLFGSRIKESWRLMFGVSLRAFLLCCVGSVLGVSVTAFFFRYIQPDGWLPASMLAGLLTGGSPNLQAIGIALQAPGEYVVLIQGTEIIGGGIYLLLLMTVVHPFLGWFLPRFTHSGDTSPALELHHVPAGLRPLAASLVLSLLTAGAAAGLTYLLTGSLKDSTLIIALLTSISILLSLTPTVNSWQHSFRQGEYFVLIFCIALGMQADFSQLLTEGLPLAAFTLVGLVLAIFFHFLLGWLFRVDRDNMMIATTATIYGPPFIPQIIAAIGNRSLLAPGIAMGLLGLVLGNYIGFAVAYSLRSLLF